MKDNMQICYQKSIDLLKSNSTKYGLLASGQSIKAKQRNYLSIFGRDACICVLGMVASGDKTLIKTAKKSLASLAKYQAPNGQIPFYVQPEKKIVDFYYLGCLDSTLWWLIALKFIDNNLKTNLSNLYKTKIGKAMSWLSAQEHQKFYLLQQNEASDWADLMPRSGYVLYTNALWYLVKQMYSLPKANETKKYFNYMFDANVTIPGSEIKNIKKLQTLKNYISPQKNNPCYLSFVNYSFYGAEIDVLGNLLAILINANNRNKKKQIINYLLNHQISNPIPTKTVLKPINKNNILWRKYMNRHSGLNKPYQYHNGGCWPYIGGFMVTILSKINKDLALSELKKLALANKKNNWQFNEWFHGKNGKPMGIAKQSWNASMYLLAWHSVFDKKKILFNKTKNPHK